MRRRVLIVMLGLLTSSGAATLRTDPAPSWDWAGGSWAGGAFSAHAQHAVTNDPLLASVASLAQAPSAPPNPRLSSAITPAPDTQDARTAVLISTLLSDRRLAYAHPPHDPVFLSSVAAAYAEAFDPEHRVFLRQDVEALERDPSWVANAMEGQRSSLSVPLALSEVYRTRTAQASRQVSSVIAAAAARSHWPQAISSTDSPLERPQDKKEWSDRWSDYANRSLAAAIAAHHDTTNRARRRTAYALVTQANFLPSSGPSKADVLGVFYDAYARQTDPHSDYFPPQQAADFAMTMASALDGIGAVLEKLAAQALVRSVIPGSPAALAGILPGDRLLAVGSSPQSMHPVDPLSIQQVVALVRGPRGSSVVLDLLHASTGKTERLSLVRQAVQLVDQKAKMRLIETDGHRIAAIALPLFYHDFSSTSPTGNSAAADVEKLLMEAKDQRVSAVVLDLSGNGGGSMQEALDMVGLFLPPGPVVQVKTAEQRPTLFISARKTPVWTGPLAVVIDQDSASASEIVASALQDRSRALVVGSRSYGKGTVQTLIDLNQFRLKTDVPMGQLKLTTAQFFRPSGPSTQRIGVVPDVVLVPSIEPHGEQLFKNALPPAELPMVWSQQPSRLMTPEQRTALAEKSAQRLAIKQSSLAESLSGAHPVVPLPRPEWDEEAARITLDAIDMGFWPAESFAMTSGPRVLDRR